jgi:iron complex transport system ATP-binding protein
VSERRPARPCLEAIGIGYAAGSRRLLDGVGLDLAGGEVTALVGPNGAGKSTLLKVLAGDLVPTEGRVLLDGVPLAAYRPVELALRRAVLPQQTVLQFAFTAREVVRMGRSPHLSRRRDEARDEAVVGTAMAWTETTPLAPRAYPILSGGEQGRVTLARILAQEAPILLLDEPTASLDLRHQQQVMAIARRLAAGGAAVLAVLHDLNLAAGDADRIALLSGGRLVAVGPPRAVLRERLLSEVFACPLAVTTHPLRDCPLVLPLPLGSAAESGRDRQGSGQDGPGPRPIERHDRPLDAPRRAGRSDR